MMSGAFVGSFLVGVNASCAVAGCVGSFLVGATASCAVAGCVGSFLVGATASCAVAGCVGSFLVGATASCAVAGCVGSFLVGATASCAVAGCVGSFLVGATASCAVAGCAPGAQRSRSVFVVSSFCALCLLYLPFVGSRPCSCCRSERRVNNSVCSCHGCYTHIYPYWAMWPYRRVTYRMYIVLVFYI